LNGEGVLGGIEVFQNQTKKAGPIDPAFRCCRKNDQLVLIFFLPNTANPRKLEPRSSMTDASGTDTPRPL